MAPKSITPSTPRFVAPDFSVTIAPNVAGNRPAPERTNTATNGTRLSINRDARPRLHCGWRAWLGGGGAVLGAKAFAQVLSIDHAVQDGPEQHAGHRGGHAELHLQLAPANQQR